jgi:hypothetical protein
MTVSVKLLDDLERRCEDLVSAINDVRNDGSMSYGKHYGTRACGKLKRKILDVHEVGVRIRRGEE